VSHAGRIHHHVRRAAFAAVIATLALVGWAALQSSAAEGPPRSAQVLMPFAGAWANDFGTAPWEHSRTAAEDWTMDVFAPDTDVHARIGNVTGALRLEIAPPEDYGCTGGGQMVWVSVSIDGQPIGRFGYHHLTDIEHPSGTVIDGVADVRIGRTVASPFALGGACWNVSTTTGIHTHLVLDNASGSSCYVRYTKGAVLDRSAVVAVLGGPNGSSWGAGPRDECDPDALTVGAPLLDSTDPDVLRESSPHLFHSLANDALLGELRLTVHPRSGETLVGWHEFDGATGATASFLQRLAPNGQPIGDPRQLSGPLAGAFVRLDDVIARQDTDGWIALHDDGSGAEAGQRLVLSQIGTSGSRTAAGVAVDDGPSTGGRLSRDPATANIVAAWTRPLGAGPEVAVARFDHTGLGRLGEPTVVQTADPGEAVVVEEVLYDPVTGSTYVLTQSTVGAAGASVAIERNVVRISPGGSQTRHRVEQPSGVSYTRSHAGIDENGDALIATLIVHLDGSTDTLYELWSPGDVAPSEVSGPRSTRRPAVTAAPGGGFGVVHSGFVNGDERVLHAVRAADGTWGPTRGVSQPLHERAALRGVWVSASPVDDSLAVVTRELLDSTDRLSSASDRVGLPVTAPGAPRNVLAVPDDVAEVEDAAVPRPGARLTITWDPPATDGGAPLTRYSVDVTRVGAGPTVKVEVDGDTTTARIDGLDGDADHIVVVTAHNEVGAAADPDPPQLYVPLRPLEGYWMLEVAGRVHGFGDAEAMGPLVLNGARAVALTPTHTGGGYWVLDTSGTVSAFGDALHYGDLFDTAVELDAGEGAVSMSALPTSDGYWIFTDRGRAVAFGAATHHGDVSHLELNGPIIDSVATPSGNGYYQVGSDGGIFANGDAAFHGSIQTVVDLVAQGTAAADWLTAPIVGLVPTPAQDGYWLVAADGGTFSFGGASYRGSVPQVLPGIELNAPINAMVAYGDGYLMVASDGGVFTFSDKAFLGSLGDVTLDSEITAVAPIG